MKICHLAYEHKQNKDIALHYLYGFHSYSTLPLYKKFKPFSAKCP